MFIPQPDRPTPSPRARALADRLRGTIAEQQRREPKLTSEDVLQALQEVQPEAPRTAPPRLVLLLAGVVGLCLAVVLGVVANRGSGASAASSYAVVAWVSAAAVLGALAVVLRLRSRR